MTLREQIAQLFFIRPESLLPDLTPAQAHDIHACGMTEVTPALVSAAREYPVGGFVLFGKNIVGPAQLLRLTADLRALTPVPPLLSLDEEGGRVARIARNDAFSVFRCPPMRALGDAGDPAAVEHACHEIGLYLRSFGFGLDLAPVADLCDDPLRGSIRDRAFGGDPAAVADMVCAAQRGFRRAGIRSCLKHFPGCGDAVGDTHEGAVAVAQSWDALCARELVPYRAALPEADAVMISHQSLPAVTGDDLPASLSRVMMVDKLRDTLHFRGAIMTDSLAMGAVADRFSSAESAVRALAAGADILLMPGDFRAAFDAVCAAVESGTLPRARIAESAARVAALKSAL